MIRNIPKISNSYEISKHKRRCIVLIVIDLSMKKSLNETIMTINSQMNQVYDNQDIDLNDSGACSPRFNEASNHNLMPTAVHGVTFSSRSDLKSEK